MTFISAVEAGSSLDELAINTVRTLAMDAVEKAQSGHPGTAMALAPVGYTLWSRFLRYDPERPDWPNRDRFVLSAGHASMLLYALIHLAGIREIDADGVPTGEPAVGLDDIRGFRELSSKTPGHPEYRMTTGVETTTGPLGQGCGNSVGMAMASRWLGATFNREGATLFDHDVYALCGDGDMMEGVSSEAASIAGNRKLSNLCWIYDDNTLTIDGHTDLTFSEDVAARFRAYGWKTLHVTDANDTEAFARAVETFRATDDAPTLIVVTSIIGYGAPNKANTSKAHGEPLGPDEVAAAKRAYGWPRDAQFLVPDGVADHLRDAMTARSRPLREGWDATLERYRADHPDLAAILNAMRSGHPPIGWDEDIPTFDADEKGVATRVAGGKVMNAIAVDMPALLGGAGDVASSTTTKLTFADAGTLDAATPGGRNIHFGIREHAMGAIANGMALSDLRPFTATYLVFSDYMRPPIRLAAIMEVPTIFVFTHDSIGVGQDGPTHQPIEHLASLRAIPGLHVVRPGDANETAEAWRMAVEQTHAPSCLILSRQAMPTIDRTRYAAADGLRRGAYVLADPERDAPQVILIASGSEVSLVLAAHERLAEEGVRSRVVSMPSWSLFETQGDAYREAVLPRRLRARLAVEQGGSLGWDRYVGLDGGTITMSTFGSSAPLDKLQAKYGFTVDNVCDRARDLIAQVETLA